MMLWKTKFRNWLEIASDVSDVLIHIRDKPRLTDVASIGLKLCNSYIHHSSKLNKNSPFKEWHEVSIWEYTSFIFDLIKVHHEIDVIEERGDDQFIISEVYGEKIGWIIRGSYINGPYVESEEKKDKGLEVLGRIVWESLGSNACVLAKHRNEDGENVTGFKVDDLKDDIYESQMAKDILNRSKAFLDKGYSRSIMLYGRPGTGKSSSMRYIAREFGKFSLRLNVSELQHLDSGDIINAIEILKPDTLLIDDFDRMSRPESLLGELEQFNKTIKIFIVSVNNIKDLDGAVIRPGRFDDHIEVEKIDAEIVARLIGENVPLEVHERLSNLPIAYITEFHKRKEVLGVEKAIEEIEELEKRIAHISKKISNDDDDDDEELEDWEVEMMREDGSPVISYTRAGKA